MVCEYDSILLPLVENPYDTLRRLLKSSGFSPVRENDTNRYMASCDALHKPRIQER